MGGGGEGVTNFQVGDEVLGIASGSFSTYVTTDSRLLAKKPSSISFEDAATIPIASCPSTITPRAS